MAFKKFGGVLLFSVLLFPAECRENKFLLSTYHPGAFKDKWTCCDGKDKGTQGCQETFVTRERKNAQNNAGM